jgi:hypothetical protein
MRCFAIAPEPDWTNRLEVLTVEETRAFTAPTVGDRVTLVPRVGKKRTGVISAIAEDTVTVDGKRKADSRRSEPRCGGSVSRRSPASQG